MATLKRKDTLHCARLQKTQKGPMDIILFSIFLYFRLLFFLGSERAWMVSELAIDSKKNISKQNNVVTWVAVTSSPQFSRAIVY